MKKVLMTAVVMGGLLATSCTRQSETAATPPPMPAESQPAATAPAGGAAAPAGAPAGAPAASVPSTPQMPLRPSVPPPPPPRVANLPAGTRIAVRTTTALSTKTHQTGQPFAATLTAPIVEGTWVVAEKGAEVEGVIVNSDEGGRVKGRAELQVTLKRLTLADGRKVAIATGAIGQEAKSNVKKDAVKVGIASGIGAAIGAIAGGGRGAAIGAGVGGGAGTGAVLATRGEAAVIPGESVLTFRLSAPVSITEKH